MKQRQLLMLALLAAVLMVACKGNKNKETIELLPAAEQDTVTHSMSSCDFNDSITAWNTLVTFLIHREPCDSMPVVTDQYGTKYKDNIFELTIEKNGHPFFRHKFTKNNFRELMTPDFRKHGMFDGFRCAGFQDGKIVFGTCVSYPESDMTQPFLIRVAQDGSFSVEVDKTPINENPADSLGDEEGV